jgi:putative restriction endonuclease
LTLGDSIIKKFADLQRWKRDGERAPHKPLLILLALGRLYQGSARLMTFTSVEKELAQLLIEFGPPRKSVHPEYPFWRLQRDNVWEVQVPHNLTLRQSNSDPLKSQLRTAGVAGGFTEELYSLLKAHPEIGRTLARVILQANFPASLENTIAVAVGLDLDATVRHVQRDASFRREVISAWGHQCGFCGYDLKIDSADLGLEAAHIRWVQFGGPDMLENGICCCSIHHQALDRGAIGVDTDLRIIVSSNVHGGHYFREHFSTLHGRSLIKPSRNAALPKAKFLSWHRKEVFRGEPRD